MASSLGKLNPFRYRGYIYDNETGFYYLNSRYYDPETGRFLNADVYISTGQGILGYNMFAYCLNNPVNRFDDTGCMSQPKPQELTLNSTYDGMGIAMGAALTYTFIKTFQQENIAVSYKKVILLKEKTEEEESAVTIIQPPSETIIYRYGGTNPGNLTPKDKDIFTGLSFSLTPPPPGVPAAVTSIEALNATGIVIAFQDGPNHVSVIPAPHVGTLRDWIRTGASHPCTLAVKSVVIKWTGVK